MGLQKRISVKGRNVIVKTISHGNWMLLRSQNVGQDITAGKMLQYCMSEDDWNYLQNLDYEFSPEEDKTSGELINALVEVNPGAFQKRPELKMDDSISGRQVISDGSLVK